VDKTCGKQIVSFVSLVTLCDNTDIHVSPYSAILPACCHEIYQ